MRFSLLIILVATSASATTSLYFSGNEAANSATATQYLYISGTNTTGTSASENTKYNVFAATGSLTDLRVKVNVAPGAGKSYTYTLRKNKAASTVSCAISGTNTTCISTSTYLAVGSTDYVTMQITPAGTPTRSTPTWTIAFLSSTTGQSPLGSQGTPNTASTFYQGMFGTLATAQTAEGSAWGIVSSSGVLSNLIVLSTAPAGSGKSIVATIRRNASATSVTCTISGTSQTICTDNTNTQRFAPGDRLSISYAPSGTPANSQISWGAVFTADQKDEFNISSGRAQQFSTTATQYTAIMAGNSAPNATESITRNLSQNTTAQFSLQAMYVYLDAAPGAAKSYTLNFRVNGANPSPQMTCAVSGASVQACEDTTHPFVVANDDYVGIQSVPSGTPTARRAAIGFRGVVRARRLSMGDL